MLTKILAVFSLLFFSKINGEIAVAVFDVNVSGTVTVTDGTVMVNIDVSKLDTASLPVSTCFTNGLKYHIHEKWLYSDGQSKVGATACGKSSTGGHYDPWAACAPQSGNLYCSVNGGCVNSSLYSCTPQMYKNNPYACEVGDWSGKYGILMLDANNQTRRNDSSFWEIDAQEIANKSIVFHCNTAAAERAFCAQFRLISPDKIDAKLEQNGTISAVTADFTDALKVPSGIVMVEDGTYSVLLDVGMVNSTCPLLNYRIYDRWMDSTHTSLSGPACGAVVGNFYDPTKTCLPFSDEPLCMNGTLCGNSSWVYSCDYNANPYLCSPSDLSGKWGLVNVTQRVLKINGKDDLLSPMDMLFNKSIVLLCNEAIIACAQIQMFSETTMTPSTTDDNDSSSAYYNIFITFCIIIATCFFI